MNQPSRKTEWAVWSGLALVILGVTAAFAWSKLGVKPLPVIGQLSNFSLTNQNNEVISLASLKGQVWVADIIFTRCPSSCPIMTRRMAKLEGDLPANQPVRLVTLTRDPGFDTPQILKRYGEQFKADFSRWDFLTGPEPQIRELAVNDFKFVALEKPTADRAVPDDLFIHSTYFVLVDKQGRVRGWTGADGALHASFESTDETEQGELLKSIKQLLAEGSQ